MCIINFKLSEILYDNARSEVIPIYGYVDSRQLAEQVKSSNQCLDERMRLDVASLQQDIERGVIKQILWKQTGDNLADCLTKRTADPQKLNEVVESGFCPDLKD